MPTGPAGAVKGWPMILGERAVVVGAGVGGLLAARVLADSYRRVTVIDRDELPDDASQRPGVPQGRHVHALLTGGTLAIRELFPGLVEQLVADGAPAGDVLADGRVYFDGHRLARAPSRLPGLGVSRPYLEHHLRRWVGNLANVDIVAGCAATGLTASPDRSTIVGVRIRRGEGEAGWLAADLVVDASGRGSSAPRWLSDLGFETPVEDRVAVDVGYASCEVALPAAAFDGDLGIAVGATVAVPRGGAIVRVENERCLVSLAGYRGAHPPLAPDDFLAFARSLVVPDLHDVLLRATPVSRPVRYRIAHAVRRRYERLARFPDGLVVLGDAVAAFNPLYGQGMSVAARQAMILRDCLRHGPRALRRIRHLIARAGAVAWTMSVSSDLRMPWIDGTRSPMVRLGHAYARRLYRAASHDPAVARAFMRVANLVDHPSRIARPGIMMRVLAPRVGRT